MSGATKVRRRRFPWWLYIVLLVLILLFALAPIVSVAIASAIAESHGCVLNEGSAHPCLIDGQDWGSTLYAMGVMGWFMLATIPIGLAALAIWMVALIVHRVLWGRRRPPAP